VNAIGMELDTKNEAICFHVFSWDCFHCPIGFDRHSSPLLHGEIFSPNDCRCSLRFANKNPGKIKTQLNVEKLQLNQKNGSVNS